jgi:alpha-beta hydrolase superfamily lysophospholipase
MSVLINTTRFRTRDGLQLVSAHRLVAQPRARVVIVHGFAEHLRRYEGIAEELAAAGYSCHQFDLRGHGRSEGNRGHVSSFEEYRDDLELFLKHTQEVLDSVQANAAASGQQIPWLLLAHSLGGLITLSFVLHHPEVFVALALSSPFLAPSFKLPFFADQFSAVAAHLVPTLPIRSIMKPEWLSHDPVIVEAYTKDPLVFSTCTPSWWTAVRGEKRGVLERSGEIKTPALFLLGDADRIADWHCSQQVFDRLRSEPKRLELYHGFFHEVLNEIGRERVNIDILSWFDERSSSTVS